MAKTETLPARLARKPIVVAPGVYDPLTALLASQAGFATLYVSGAAIAYTRLGRPDIDLVGMTEVAATLALIRDRVEAHLIVDADTGYGNALNVARTVRAFEEPHRALDIERVAVACIGIDDEMRGDAVADQRDSVDHLAHADEANVGAAEPRISDGRTGNIERLEAGAFGDQCGERVVDARGDQNRRAPKASA